MVHLSDVVDLDQLAAHIAAGYVNEQWSPDGRLRILNYSHACQYAGAWDATTRACRGLVVDRAGTVWARPFPKFHNVGEHGPGSHCGPLPVGASFEVFEKLDGSLAVIFRGPDGEVRITTRGSFVSDQALHAQQVWADRYADVDVPPGVTWLAEIIYPENRVVVSYGATDDLFLLAVIDNETGCDLPMPGNWPGPVVQRYDHDGDLERLVELAGDDSDIEDGEGWVIRYTTEGGPSLRAKVKLSRYLAAHRMLCGLSTTSVWEMLARGDDPLEYLTDVPDEFYRWADRTCDELVLAYQAVEDAARARFAELAPLYGDRKAFAQAVQADPYRALLFKLLDEKDIAPTVWRMVKPPWRPAFIDNDN